MLLTGLTGPLVLDVNADRQLNNWFMDMGPDGRFRRCVSIVNTLNGGRLNMVTLSLPYLFNNLNVHVKRL